MLAVVIEEGTVEEARSLMLTDERTLIGKRGAEREIQKVKATKERVWQ